MSSNTDDPCDSILSANHPIIEAVDLHSKNLVRDYVVSSLRLATHSAVAQYHPITGPPWGRQTTVAGTLTCLKQQGIVDR